MQLIDLTLIGSMGLPGGGRSSMAPRLLRHFHLVSIVQPDNSIIVGIFSNIIEWHLSKVYPGIDPESKKSFHHAIEATVDLYQ